MFNVGDNIVYPMHGAGKIAAIEERNILGEKQSYYVLKMPGEVKVMVPVEKAEETGLREVINKEDVKKVFSILEENKVEISMNWNKRYKENYDKIKTGDIFKVADVYRDLSIKQKEKGLSTGEKKMLSNAKEILVSELVLAEGSQYDIMEEIIENKITKTFNETKMVNVDDTIGNIVKKFIPYEGTGTE